MSRLRGLCLDNMEETGKQVHILIVDDDKVIADIFKDLLAVDGRTIEVCYDGRSAIENLRKKTYDLIIVDLIMPETGGMDILRFAREINPDVMVVIVTGHASLETAITAIKQGAYDYIRKPCRLDEIRIVIDNAVEKIRLDRENKRLIGKLRKAYHELMALKKKFDTEKTGSINFFSSNMSGLHYLYNRNSNSKKVADKLQALSGLKDNGTLSQQEFDEFKKYLLNMTETQT